jgi:putative membrane protein
MIGYYSYLFTFPSRRAMTVSIAILSTVGCTLVFFFALGATFAFQGLLTFIVYEDDVFLTPRRFAILTYSSSIIYVGVFFLSSLILVFSGRSDLIPRAFMFGVAANASLRYLVIQVFSTKGLGRSLVAAFVQPFLCLITGSFLLSPSLQIMYAGLIGNTIMVGGVKVMLWVISRKKGLPSGLELIPLFRAFILAWAEEVNEPLEEQITLVGEVKDLFVDSLVFRNALDVCKAGLVIPNIHPGPFRNVGSSALPNILTVHLGRKLNCDVLVPHGISTHELDITRIDETKKVVDAVASDLHLGKGFDVASPVFRTRRKGAQVSCQMFGNVAIVTLTLSPKSFDDLPEELGVMIREAASRIGVKAVIIDSHNSILQVDELNDCDVDNLFHAAIDALRRAKTAAQKRFSVGTARVVPSECGLDEGMGPNGVAALVVKIENCQKGVYVILDGNNMISGLREKIINELKSLGFDETMVLTSDTHLVNAIGATTRGYYPIGEKIDEDMILGYVVDAVEAATTKLENCRSTHIQTWVKGLTVLGGVGLHLLSDVLETAFNVFKSTALAVSIPSLTLSTAVIFLL